MIIKIVRTASSGNLLDYLVNQEHEVLDAKGVLPFQDINTIKKEFNTRELTNSKAKNIAYNIIVSFPLEDRITKSIRLDLLEDIMAEFNGGSDLWFAVSHPDTINHQHFHCALSAIKLDGVSIDMAHFAKRAIALSRKLEIKYGLKQVSSERTLFSNQAINDLKLAIDHSISEAHNLAQFIEIMLLSGYKCKVGRGITFIKMENNHSIKGSAVGPAYSLGNLLKNFQKGNTESSPFTIGKQDILKNSADRKNIDLLDIGLTNSSRAQSSYDSAEDEELKKKRRKKRRRR